MHTESILEAQGLTVNMPLVRAVKDDAAFNEFDGGRIMEAVSSEM